MNTATDLKEQAYAAIFDKLDHVFPEFDFRKRSAGWVSTNVTKIDGREGKTKGQVICTYKVPTLLADHSDKTYISFWDYIQQQDSLDNQQTYNKLLDLAGIEKPKRELTPAMLKDLEERRRKWNMWKLFMDSCKKRLWQGADPTVKDYLLNQRKYTPEDVTEMELGEAADWLTMENEIRAASQYSEDEIREVLKYSGQAIGQSHKLIIPVRNAAGEIEGIIARNVNYQATDKLPKYLNSTGLEKSRLLYGHSLRPVDGKVILTEGQLDAGIANARGISGTAVAIGGKDISEEQVRQLLNSSAKDITICLDNEPATVPSIKKAIKLIQQLDEDEKIADRIYIATLPAGIKDADELITTQGIQAFQFIVDDATSFQRYLVDLAVTEHSSHTDRGINSLIDEVVTISSTLRSPARKDELNRLFVELLNEAGIPVSRDALEEAATRIKDRENKQEQQRLAEKMLKRADKLIKEGETGEALTLLKKEGQRLETKHMAAQYQDLYTTILTEDHVRRKMRQKPAGADTGIAMRIGSELERLIAPAGQLTFFAAPTNHGKTLIMLNMALNIIRAQPDRSVHFFTYEMDAETVQRFALNIFIGQKISNNQRRSIDSYLKDITHEYVQKEHRPLFMEKVNTFYSQLVDTGRLKIYFTEYSTEELTGFIRYIQKQDPGAVIIIDYVQRQRSNRAEGFSARQAELKQITEDLNTCAINTMLPIILASQFSREVQTPLDMKNQAMSEASDIEKTAREIFGLWNCMKGLTGKKDANLLKDLSRIYDLDFAIRNPYMILQILKSSQFITGDFIKLAYDTDSGRLSSELPEPAQGRSVLKDIFA